MIKRFDIVRLLTTRRIVYLSGPSGQEVSPHGNWIVAAGVGGTNKVMCCKEGTVIQVPVGDVERVAEYNLDVGINAIKNIRNKQDLDRFKESWAWLRKMK